MKQYVVTNNIVHLSSISSYYEKFLATGEVKCIDEEIPFEIPKGWEWCRLSLFIYPPKYGTSKKSSPSGILPVLRMGNIQNGEIVFDKLVYSNDLDDNKKLLLQYGDLLFNRTNSAELVGKTAIFRGQQNVIFAGYLILLRPILINSEYLNLLLNTPYARDYCNEVKTIGVQQCNINAEKISNLLIPVPNLHETVAIVEKVKNIALPIIKYGELYQKLKHLNRELPILLRKSILQEAIQGKLVSQIADEGTAQELLKQIRREKWKLVKDGKLKKSALTDSIIYKGDDNKYYEQIGNKHIDITNSIPFDIPLSWKWIRLGTLFNHCTGKALNASNKEGVMKSYITTSNLYWNHFALDKLKQMPFTENELDKCTVTYGDLLVCEGGDIGRAAVWREDYNICIQNHVHKLRSFIPTCTMFYFYVFYFYKSVGYIGGKGIGIQGLSSRALDQLTIPLPPKSEQERIVEKIENLFDKIKGQFHLVLSNKY